MKHIVTIQHTQSQHHVNGMVGSWTDWPLTGLGMAQAKAICQNLAAELENCQPEIGRASCRERV